MFDLEGIVKNGTVRTLATVAGLGLMVSMNWHFILGGWDPTRSRPGPAQEERAAGLATAPQVLMLVADGTSRTELEALLPAYGWRRVGDDQPTSEENIRHDLWRHEGAGHSVALLHDSQRGIHAVMGFDANGNIVNHRGNRDTVKAAMLYFAR